MSDEARHKLAEELQKLDMPEEAQNALEGYYSDFDSPLVTPKMVLVEALWTRAEVEQTKGNIEARDNVLRLREQVMAGEFDG